jgi:hypothetical protein
VIAFFGKLYYLKWRQDGENCTRWIPSKRKKFEVRFFFHELSSSRGVLISLEYLESQCSFENELFIYLFFGG